MPTPRAVAGAFWITWLMIWGIGVWWWASPTARQQRLGARLASAAPLYVGAWLMFFRPGRIRFLGPPLLPPGGPVAWLGAVLVLCGLGFAVWARVHLGRNWSSTPSIKMEHRIIRSGPYGITRHPIYTGLLLAFVGQALVTTTLGTLLGLGCGVAGLLLKIPQEEALLVGHFGEAYRAYRADVPGLLPRLGRGRHGS